MATEVEDRADMSLKELIQNEPQMAKDKPVHPYLISLNDKLTKGGFKNKKYVKDIFKEYPDVEKLYNEIYNTTKGGSSNANSKTQGSILENILPKEILSNLRQWYENLHNKQKDVKIEKEELDNSSFYLCLITSNL